MRSVAVMVAATIGAGIFGVPYVMAKAGILVGLVWLVVVAGVLMLENLLLGEIALRMPDNLRFAGIARHILKPRWAHFTNFLLLLSLLGAMIAYLMLGSQFLSNLLSTVLPVNQMVVLIIYFIISAIIISRPFSEIERLDVFTVSMLVALIGLLVTLSFSKVHWSFISYSDSKQVFFFFFFLLFALASAGVIPMLEASLTGHKRELRKIIIIGGLIAAAVTAIFGLVVAGVSAYATTTDAVTGLSVYAGNFVLYLGSLIGLVAMIGIHGLTGNNVKEILVNDYKISPRLSFLIAIILPLLVVISGMFSFIKLLGLIGGVVSGLVGIMIGVMSLRSHHMITRSPEYCLKWDRLWAWVVIIFFAAGGLYELYYTFLK